MISIIQGSKATLNVRLLMKTSSLPDPLDLTGVTEITTCFFNQDGTELMPSLTGGEITVTDAIFGKIAIALTAAQTLILAAVDSATLEISIDFGSGVSKVQIPAAYSVIETVC